MNHAKPDQNQEAEEEDRVDAAIRKTGCSNENYAVQDCMFEHKDWRKCQKQVKAFKECIMKSNQRTKGDG